MSWADGDDVRLSGRFSRLVLAYALVAVAVLVAHTGLRYLTGYFYRNGKVWIGGRLMVDHGRVYHSLYTGQLVWHALATFFIVTVWHLTSDQSADSSKRFAWLLTSRRVNIIAGVLFIFGGLGLVFGKSTPDPVQDSIVFLDFAVVVLVVLRVICRGIYSWRFKHSG